MKKKESGTHKFRPDLKQTAHEMKTVSWATQTQNAMAQKMKDKRVPLISLVYANNVPQQHAIIFQRP